MMIDRAVIAVVVCSSLFFSACEESIPARDDLSHQVNASVRSGYITENNQMYLRFYLTVTNRLDEVLDGQSAVKGTIQISWQPGKYEEITFNPTRKLSFTADNIFSGIAHYNRQTGKLRLPPNDSIVFYVNWDMKTDDSTYLMNHFPGFVDAECAVIQLDGYLGYRRISNRQQFVVSANIKLYDQLSVLYSQPMTVSHCLVGRYRSASDNCKNLNLIDPCTIVGQ
jgi:hypothetical protein